MKRNVKLLILIAFILYIQYSALYMSVFKSGISYQDNQFALILYVGSCIYLILETKKNCLNKKDGYYKPKLTFVLAWFFVFLIFFYFNSFDNIYLHEGTIVEKKVNQNDYLVDIRNDSTNEIITAYCTKQYYDLIFNSGKYTNIIYVKNRITNGKNYLINIIKIPTG